MAWIVEGEMSYLNDRENGALGCRDLEGLIVDRDDVDGECEVEEPSGRVRSTRPEPE